MSTQCCHADWPGHFLHGFRMQLEEPVDGDSAHVERRQTGGGGHGAHQVVARPELVDQPPDGLDEERLPRLADAADEHAQRLQQRTAALAIFVSLLVTQVRLERVKDASLVCVEHGESLLQGEGVGGTDVDVEVIPRFTRQVGLVVVPADSLLLAVGMSGVVDVPDVGMGGQHPLQSAVVGGAVAVRGQQAAERLFRALVGEEQVALLSEGNEEEYERVVVGLPLVLPFGVEDLVVGKSSFGQLSVLPISVGVDSAVVVVGHKVVETDAFHIRGSAGIVVVQQVLVVDVATVGTVLGHVFQGLVVFEPTTPLVGHGDVHPLDGGGLLGEVVAKQEVAGLVQSTLPGA